MSHPAAAPILKWLSTLVGVAVFAAAAWFIRGEILRLGWQTIHRDFHAIPHGRMVAAILLTLAAYGLLSLYDVLAFRYIGNPLPQRKVLFAGFIGYTFSNSISMTPSMAARFKLYRRWGLSVADISKVFFFHYLSTWLGFFVVAGVLLFIEPSPLAQVQFLTFDGRRWLGLALLGLVGLYFILGSVFREGIHFRRVRIPLPQHRLMLVQLFVATADWSLTALVPYILISAAAPVHYLSFLGVFLFAQVVQIISHVPGGLGVFEGAVILLLKGAVPSSSVIAVLLVYRVLFSLIPLGVGSIAFGMTELLHARRRG